jgi:hypothetical protein
MKLSTQDCWSDNNRSVEGTDRHSKMATEGHRKKSKAEKLAEEAEETRKLYELKADIEKMELRMRQDRRRRRLRELPMEKAKAKWPVKQLMVIRQRRLLKRWLRYAENLRATEEDMICYCWPETGQSLDGDDDDDDWNKLESADGFKYCRLGRKEEIPICHEGNELRSVEDLTDCHEDSQEHFQRHCQLGDERRSGEDLKDCQEGSESVLSCLEGRDEKSRLSESLLDSRESSIQQRLLMKMGSMDLKICQEGSGSIPHCGNEQVSSGFGGDQQVQLTTGDLEGQIMIGGVSIFLPSAKEEAENSVVQAATTEQSQLEMTVEEEELEQASGTAQADAKKNECSEGQLKNFSQQAGGAVALKLTAKAQAGAKEEDEHSEEWLSIFSTEAENIATGEIARVEGEREHSKECINTFSKGAEEVAALKLAAEDAEEQVDGFISPWEMELEMLEDWLNNPEPARELKECELSEKRMTEQQVSQEETAELEIAVKWRLRATDEDEKDGMGDHDDLPNGQNLLQLGRLQRQSQPQEQLDREIEDIRRLMLRSAQTTSEEKLGREKAAAAQRKQQQQQSGAHEKLQRLVWDPGGFQQLQGKLMSRSS